MKQAIMVMVVLMFGACGGPTDEPEITEITDGNEVADGAEASEAATQENELAKNNACPTDAFQDKVGQQVADIRGEFPDGTRFIPPGGLITQELDPKRVNVDLDANGKITRVWCG